MEIVSGEAAVANVAADPANLMIYGPPGTEKTTESVRAFVRDGRCTAFFVPCEEGALKPILSRGLPMPDHPKTLIRGTHDMGECLDYLAKNRHRYTAAIFDTVSTWSANLNKQFEASGIGKKNGWAVPVAVRDSLSALRDYVYSIGLHGIYLAHERTPSYSETGVLHEKGGPLLFPAKAGSIFYPRIDTILRVSTLNIQGNNRRVYLTGGLDWDTQVLGFPPTDVLNWWAKNREGVSQGAVPADLGNYLRARQPPYAGL